MVWTLSMPVVYFHTGDANRCWKVDPPSEGTCEDLPERYHIRFCAPEAWHDAAKRFRRALPENALDETHAVLDRMETHPHGPEEFYTSYLQAFTLMSREEQLDGVVRWRLKERGDD